jgi:5-methylcytosine-specific restriction endonuclease McrA
MTDRRMTRYLGTAKLVHNNAAYRKNRAQFKARCRARGAPCHICHGELGPIDYDAEPQTSKAFELDHIKPVATHPHLYYVEANWAASHSACNRSRQKKELSTPPKEQKRWVKPSW